jgi:hypothetical protein
LDKLGAEARIREYVQALSEREAGDFIDQFRGGNTLDEAYEEEFGPDPTPPEALAQSQNEIEPDERPDRLVWAKEQIESELLEAHTQAFVDGSRESTMLMLNGMDFEVSGGMSWGDEPTEIGPMLSKLDWTGIFDLPVRKGALDLSTGHVPLEKLDRNVPDLKVVHRCQAHEYGWVIFLGDKEEDTLVPDWFRPILKVARASGCMFINFDRDGDRTDLLPWYGYVATASSYEDSIKK